MLLIADDLGTDYLGFYENYADTVDVPNIRAIAQNGIRFTQFTTNPVCSSTRSTILSGRYAFRTGVGYIVGSAAGSGTLDTSEMTIPRQLELYDSSIRKANIGKWHLHNPSPAANLLFPLVLGYDHFEGPFVGALPSYTNWTKYTNGAASNVTNYATSENVDNAINWLKTSNTSQAFFLWTAFNAPHDPYHLPPVALHNYSNLSGTAADISANPKSYFKAALQALDHEIGRLMDSLKAMHLYDSTDFIFIGDNGNALKTAQISNISKAKGTVYEYGVHTSLLISGPSVINPGRISNALINSVDLYATIIELMGQNNWQNHVTKPVDAKSILPVIQNLSDSIRPWSFCDIFKNQTDADDGKAIKNKKYKLIHFDSGLEEFYNLDADPDENNNLMYATNLSTEDINNYNYLCQELNGLLNNGNLCNNNLSLNQFLLQSNLIAYPSIFSNKLNVLNSKLPFTIYNLYGKVMTSSGLSTKLDCSSWPSGLYTIVQQSNIQKLIKQ